MTETVAAHPLTYALGYTLVRFLWQGAVIGLIAAVLLSLTRRASSSARYLIACTAFVAMTIVPILTFAQTLTWSAAMREAGPHGLTPLRADFVDDAPAVSGNPFDLFSAVSATLWSPTIVIAWSAGVLLLVTRLLIGWRTVTRMRTGAHAVGANDWLARTMARVATTLGVRRPVTVVRSMLVDVPAVVGWIRPVIVVPVSAIAGLTPSQLEAIIAHEVAHIRRHDHLVNALQTMVETVLFYHPSVWWVSKQIRIEREHCCDDIALSLGSARAEYARALTTLEEARVPGAMALSAADGSLVSRIRRVLGYTPQPVSLPRFAMLIALAMAAVSAAVGATQAGSTNPAPPPVAVATQVYPPPPPAAPPAATAPQAGPGEAQIVALEETYRRARIANDTPALERLLDSAFVSVGVTGEVGRTRNKVESLAHWRGTMVSGLTTNTRQVQLDEGAAIVRGTETQTAGRSTQQLRYVRAWKMHPATGWTLVSNIQTPVANSTGAPRRAGGTPPPPPPPPPPGLGTLSESITITGGNQTALRVGQNGVRPPVKIKDVKPVYPAAAKAAGLQGIVILEAIIDPEGNVTNLKAIRSSGSAELDDAAVDAVSQWRYTPTLLNGEPVSVICTMTVNFTLGN